ncbi:DEAD/DEAH box helicase [Desulfolutivibrio sulfoxidireducens]|uniref:DEAD/DEAH box helicase n=1 Tax=Desulfolutivibrio sulfoxidireducens TaxID=2773299 RepID=UPI00159E6322|nr:DEAD/DEAH box helicase [Desulfolutivibrio sulfoxidireducens]QLA15244.1 DEAD/DEAH box helicase [Desulfolutivibrio sulfoxidireducens]QLA18812.1 DEAD/DEAH box helicase [Desulfolutivibrio sulfoxidireducens]
MSFASFDLHPLLLANIESLGYQTPTPIQTEAIPPVMEGRDAMGLAQTGTGKTAAFLLPILNRLARREIPKRRAVKALIVAPTRELAEQIHDAVRDLGRRVNVKSVTVYGGVGMSPQTQALRRGVDIVVACPGRLLDHIRQGNTDFSALDTLVLDEADHMFDMGFLPDIRAIMDKLPAKRQTLLFSATMPDSIKKLAADILTDPITVRIGRQAPAETVEHAVYPVSPSRKTPLLLELLDKAKTDSVIVFTRTKHKAKNLAELLCKSGRRAACIQGNLSQRQRQAALDGFKAGTYRVLVATDIAARGIDVSKVGHVINFDIPDTPDAYTHRIGRTGRAECQGQAHTLITREDMPMVRAIEHAMGKPLPRRELDGFAPTPQEYRAEPDAPRDGYNRNRRPGNGGGYGRNFGQSRPAGQNRNTRQAPRREAHA